MSATTTPNTMKITTTHQPASQWGKAVTKHSVHLPESGANTVHQSGRALSKWSKGLTVNVYQREGNAPHSWEVYTDDEEQYGEGELGFHENSLEDYDGCFSLPSQVMDVLDGLGYCTKSIRESLS